MTAPKVLLAKQPCGTWSLSLRAHSLDAEEAAGRIFTLDQRLGQRFCQLFKIDEAERPRWLVNLRVACLFHDLGKANSGFYDMVAKHAKGQAIRHEHLSALVLHDPTVREWLRSNPSLDPDAITAAVLSHHLKASDNSTPRFNWSAPQQSAAAHVWLDHPEVRGVLERVALVAALPPPPALSHPVWQPTAQPWVRFHEEGMTTARQFARACRRDIPRRGFALALKAGLIAADSAASALAREGEDFRTWAEEACHTRDVSHEEVRAKIITPRVAAIERRTGRTFHWHRFQDGTAAAGRRALVMAACGTGKTLAAWRWAEAQAQSERIGKVVFLYPTRATATEGFRDYVAWAPETEASLMHGTSRYTLDRIAENPDTHEGAADKVFRLSETDARRRALGYWPRRFFSATVDQFLSFMEHQYESLCLLPVLADAALVVDEVHSFDKNTFKDLCAFLTAFDLPVLCMTATLPQSRIEQLRACGLTLYPDAAERDALDDLRAEEEAPRYDLAQIEGIDAALDLALSSLGAGRRVLWVVNTIARCQTVYDAVLSRLSAAGLSCTVLAYHSRFTLRDRERQHRAVVSDFQQTLRPCFAVTTQVCEMSLDLDADVLLTELAQCTAVVQRMGRAHRKRFAGGRDGAFRALVRWYEPDNHRPYARPELDAARAMLSTLGGASVSQRTLAEALEQFAPAEVQPDNSARFLDGGYFATPGPLRDIQEFTEPCVLDGELAAVRKALAAHDPIDGFVIPVPRKYAQPDPKADLPIWLSVAESKHYSADRGFFPQEQT